MNDIVEVNVTVLVRLAALRSAKLAESGIYTLRNCVMRKILCGMIVRKERDWLFPQSSRLLQRQTP